MGNASSSSGDINSFRSSLTSSISLPHPTSLTEGGALNELCYAVPVTDKLMAPAGGYALMRPGPLGQAESKELETWLSCFLAGALDGKKRGALPINLVVVVDCSGATQRHVHTVLAHCISSVQAPCPRIWSRPRRRRS